MKRSSRNLLVGGLALAVIVGAVGVPLVATAASNGARASDVNKTSCSLVSQGIQVRAKRDSSLETLFTDYAETGKGWTGGDSTYSLPLGGGRTAWYFSDTLLGPINKDGSRPESAPFVNNSVVTQGITNVMQTKVGGTAKDPQALIRPAGSPKNEWYWLGAPMIARNRVQVPLLQFKKTGETAFDFEWMRNRVAIFDANTFRVRHVVDLPSATGINWGSWTRNDRRITTVYGVKDDAGKKSAYVAQVHGDGMLGKWSFWDGSGWSAHEKDAAPIASNVANEYSVTRFHDGYLMVTHDTSEPLGGRIEARISCSPVGPFTAAAEIYNTPETGELGAYKNKNVYTYNAHEHVDLRRGGRLLVSYNVNTLDQKGDLYRDASIYRPRFLYVKITLKK